MRECSQMENCMVLAKLTTLMAREYEGFGKRVN